LLTAGSNIYNGGFSMSIPPIIGIPATTRDSERGGAPPANSIAQAYCRAVEMAGGVPVILPAPDDVRLLRSLYDLLDGLLLAGGNDVHPSHYGEDPSPRLGAVDVPRDRMEGALVAWALEDRLPVLAVCRGLQALNVFAGGSLYQDIAAQVPGAIKHDYFRSRPRTWLAHHVEFEPTSRLASITQALRLEVNSLHHQSVKRVAPEFRVTARAGDGVVEAIERVNGHFALGVQWHPEVLYDNQAASALFVAFVSEAGAHRAARPVVRPRF
jgi:putative glutamine amidotransferase